jgi:protein SCO1/2
MKRTISITALILAIFLVGSIQAQEGLPRVLKDVRFDQRLDQQVPLDAAFRDETGRAVRLGDYFGDKPVILVLAYYRCPRLCTEVLNGLVRALLDVPFDVGREFNVVTVSFDARETPALAAAKKKTYLERYGRRGAAEGWSFLTGQEDAIRALTDAVGFHVVYDPKLDQFAHASGITVLTPRGKIARYFYDIRYSPLDLRLSLVEASANRIGSAVDQVLLYCFHYDPSDGKYGPVVMSFVRLGGAATVLTLGMFLGILWRRERRKGKAAAAAT